VIGWAEAAIAANLASSSDEAIAIAQDWLKLQQPMVEALGVEVWNKAGKMYNEMDQWDHLAKAPFSLAVFQYVQAAAEAGRAKGVIPPRKT
jgi:MerR family transcriptional regulator, thiopeptide resistance regulator